MDKQTRPIHMLPKRDPLQTERHGKRYFIQWTPEKAGVAILTSDKIDFTTKVLTRDQERPRNSTSGSLPKETQSTNLKRHMHSLVHCSIIQNGHDMEAA